MAILEKPKVKRRQKNCTKIEKRFMNVQAVATRRRAFIVNRGFLPLPPGVDPSVVPPPRAQVVLDGKTDEQRAENPTLDTSNLPTDTEGHRRAWRRITKSEREAKLQLRETRWANRMKGIKKIFSEPVEFIAKLIFPPPLPPALVPYPLILPQVVPPPVEEVALPNQAHEQVDVPRVERQHQLRFADQGPAQELFVDQSFDHQRPVEQTYDDQSVVAQQTVEQPNQYQHQVYYQPNPNIGYDADMEDMDEDGPSQSYATQVQVQEQVAFEQQQRAAFEQQQQAAFEQQQAAYEQQQQASFEQQQRAAYEQQQQAACEQQQRYALEAQAQAAMAYQGQAQAYTQEQAPPPYSVELKNGCANAYNQPQPQQFFYSGATSAPAQPAWNGAEIINTMAQYHQQNEYYQPAPLQAQPAAQPPPKEASPPPAPAPAEPSSPIYTPEERRAWREKMQKIWADEPPKSKPWVLSTSTASISLPSQELGRNSGVKAPKTVPSKGKGEREAKPLPPRARVQSGPSAQGSGSSRQGSVSSKRGSVTGAQKKGTWRLPEPESSFEDLEAVVSDATAKKQKKRPIEDTEAVDTRTKKQKKRSIEDGAAADPDSKEKKQKKRRRAVETAVESTSSKKRVVEPASSSSKPVPQTSKETSSSLKLTPSSVKPVSTTSKPVPSTSKPVPQTSKETSSNLKLTPSSTKPLPSSMKPLPSNMKPVSSSFKPTPSTSSSSSISKKRKEASIIIVDSDADPEIDESMVRKSKRSKMSPQKEEPVATRRRSSRMPARTKVRVPVEEDEKEGKWEIPVVGGLLRAFGLRR
ncbi:hypothetical protein K443DRAFT_679637 [Laccaria amethystina LaAM-08-1]|uniref:Uncharacterized protein n=1 Tax=Laccaria amethystina LaAM-08-1 TaxID=1095629 RepID=A0A0C9WPH1_9AGAR|nr:hypothetical protein K443DRAFT_679637 [Laccaria amethystina LaAM-08-1]